MHALAEQKENLVYLLKKQFFESASIIMRIRILVKTFLHLDPDFKINTNIRLNLLFTVTGK